jgi:hypothetical protein
VLRLPAGCGEQAQGRLDALSSDKRPVNRLVIAAAPW